MLRFTTRHARHVQHTHLNTSHATLLQHAASSASARPAAMMSPTAHAASSCAASSVRLASSLRTLHTVRHLSTDGDVPDHKALKAAHQERMRLKRAAEAEAKRLADLANPPPPTEEGAAAAGTPAADGTTPAGADAPKTDATGTSDSDAAVARGRAQQSLVNALWSQLQKEAGYLKEQVSKMTSTGPERAKKVRPAIARSKIPLKEWSEDPIEKAAAQKAAEKAKDAAEADAATTEAKAPEEPAYTGSTALQAVDKRTEWEKRYENIRERVRTLSRMPTRAVKVVVAKNEALSKLSEELEDKVETAREQWETSQDPRVWRMRDAVDKVVGETETGIALGEIMSKDPNWDYLAFLKEMEEVMIPEVIQAFRVGDMKLLKSVCEGEAARAMFATFRLREEQKVEWDERILDIRGVDVVKASLHEDVPYILLTFVCQHVAAEYDAKTGEVKDPTKASVVQNTYYSWAIKRDYESKYYDWKIFEFQFQNIQALI